MKVGFMLKSLANAFFEQTLFIVVLLIELILALLIKLPAITAIDFNVLAFLCILMLISAGLEKEAFLEKIATNMIEHYHTERKIAISMIITTMLIAMFVTNDVALITVVPITLIISKKGNFNPLKIIVLETIAANFGGSFTPMGNPQNIFLYNFYHLRFGDFMLNMMPFFVICLCLSLLITLTLDRNRMPFDKENVQLKNKKNILVYLTLLVLVLLTLFNLINLQHVFVLTLLSVFLIDKKLFAKVDYFLLGTFVLFFIIIDQIESLPIISELATHFVSSEIGTMVSASLFSQLISNVPSAILIAPFSQHAQALVIGVSIGGFGTTIASLANLISYKYYINQFRLKEDRKNYLLFFHVTNFAFLIILLISFIAFYYS